MFRQARATSKSPQEPENIGQQRDISSPARPSLWQGVTFKSLLDSLAYMEPKAVFNII